VSVRTAAAARLVIGVVLVSGPRKNGARGPGA
jgi:hypothetical protein